MYEFSERLRKLLFSAHKVQGLSDLQISQQLKISRSAIAGYKNGSVIPNAKNLLKIADYFGVSTDYLLGREGYEIE